MTGLMLLGIRPVLIDRLLPYRYWLGPMRDQGLWKKFNQMWKKSKLYSHIHYLPIFKKEKDIFILSFSILLRLKCVNSYTTTFASLIEV